MDRTTIEEMLRLYDANMIATIVVADVAIKSDSFEALLTAAFGYRENRSAHDYLCKALAKADQRSDYRVFRK